MSGTYVNLLNNGVGDDYGVMRMIRAFFGEGVLTMNGVADLQVVQRGAGANQSVDVSLGDVLIYHETEKNAYYGYVKTVQNVAAAAADASNPRKDIVVVYVDLSAYDAVTPDNQGALKFAIVAGTAAGSPSDPSDATIQAAVGAANPWFKLARLNRPTSGGGGNTITNAIIDDLRLASWLAVKAQYIPSGTTIDTPVLASPTITGAWNGWVAAGETWTYASADTAAGGATSTNGVSTYTFTISGDLSGKYSAGMKVKLTQTTVKYFIITKVAYSAGTTTITLFGGTGYVLANAAITSPYYAVSKAPQGFPLDPAGWTVEMKDTSSRSQATPTPGTWYNLGSLQIALPIGSWDVTMSHHLGNAASAVTASNVFSTLSTANNSESDTETSSVYIFVGASGSVSGAQMVSRGKVITVTSKTSYFLNAKTSTGSGVTSIAIDGSLVPSFIRARCAYL